MATKEKKAKPVRFKPLDGTVESFISDGFSEITSIGEEFREIYDNAPDNLKETDVNSRRSEAADTIEGLSEPSVESSILGELSCTANIDMGKTYRGRQSQSRACRLSNGAGQLRAAADAINEWLGEHEEVVVEEDSDQPGKWLFKIGDEGSDISYDSEEDAKEALEEKLGYNVDDYNEARTEGETLAQELEEIADEAEGVDCPGMFG
jgi:hypothetical protein